MVFQAVGSTTSTGGIALESKVERLARNCCCLAFSRKLLAGLVKQIGKVKVSGCENLWISNPARMHLSHRMGMRCGGVWGLDGYVESQKIK
jgi:hypothetical protein